MACVHCAYAIGVVSAIIVQTNYIYTYPYSHTLHFQAFGAPLVHATGCSTELVPTALAYLKVRAWACPAVLASMVLQASLLAGKDSLTPFVVVLVSGALNIAGDLLLITVRTACSWGM